MIIVIVNKEINEETGRTELIVSHGFNPNTGKVVTLPPVQPEEIGAEFNGALNAYILREKSGYTR